MQKKVYEKLVISECGRGKGILHFCCPVLWSKFTQKNLYDDEIHFKNVSYLIENIEISMFKIIRIQIKGTSTPSQSGLKLCWFLNALNARSTYLHKPISFKLGITYF